MQIMNKTSENYVYFQYFNKIQTAEYQYWAEYTICYRLVSIWFTNFLFRLTLDILHLFIISSCLSCFVQINNLIASKLITLQFVQFHVNPRTLHSSLPGSVQYV